MLVSDFDYELPESLIAQEPALRRDLARLLVLDRSNRLLTDSVFGCLPEFLVASDVLVLNNTRVFPARLIGRRLRVTARGETVLGGRVEVFLVRRFDALTWEALVKPGRSLLPGARVEFARGKLHAEVLEWRPDGRRTVRFEVDGDFDRIIDRIGRTPLPPYIKRDEEDRLDAERYQTVFARERGAVAAPTAGLHFTPEVLDRVRERGVDVVEITLHVGYGTFQPVRVEHVEHHQVEPEMYTISEESAGSINRAIAEGRRVIAVGTTTTRALESAALVEPASPRPRVAASPRPTPTDLFIYPGFSFRVVSGLVTNFHLPRSSLLMLVAAFAGREVVLDAYRHAVEHEYRFYSYGDAMLLV
ncbi:MAG TPA: tRNA preQ1(34) S-adenosylmethionine ribosyltransferase-isomerase QueA [Blastocatellia bacterium]|nr:tRNA preQ1(34) S-adenosylmethionine ribosyltransferase-isomerase QueA [Blastocatellia bacterium]